MQPKMTVYPGRGDPRRALELLWRRRQPGTRGPKLGLDVDAIAATAIRIADQSGLPAVSMRAVAREMGTSAMSLYTYVPSKAELLDLMSDTALGELASDRGAHPTWRAAIEASVRDVWALFERHPWMLHISSARASLGPNSFAFYETQCRLLDGLGLSGLEVSHLVAAIHGLVRGAARDVADARAAARETGISDDEWWTARAPILEALMSEPEWAERFPTLTRLSGEHAFDQAHRAPDDTTGYMEREALDSFELGLRCLLDGVETLVAGRRSSKPTP
jgi:AcrR family transcriptional regulator